MLSIANRQRIFVCRDPADMRCGRYRLGSLVSATLGQDPLSGDLFLFFNKRANSVKILYFDQSGYAIWHKVLEGGTFKVPLTSELNIVELTAMLEGIEIKSYSKRKRYKTR